MPPSNTKAVTSIFVKVAAFYKIFYGFQKELIMSIKLFYGIKKHVFPDKRKYNFHHFYRSSSIAVLLA